jgi:hypothetical protein
LRHGEISQKGQFQSGVEVWNEAASLGEMKTLSFATYTGLLKDESAQNNVEQRA